MWHRRHILPGRCAAVLLPAACYKVASAACDCSTLSRPYYDHPVSGSARPRSVTRVPYQDTGDRYGPAPRPRNRRPRPEPERLDSGDICGPAPAPQPPPVTRLPVRFVCPEPCSGHWNVRPHAVEGPPFPDLWAGFCRVPAPPPSHAVCTRIPSEPSPVPVFSVQFWYRYEKRSTPYSHGISTRSCQMNPGCFTPRRLGPGGHKRLRIPSTGTHETGPR